ncbi:MerR family transcriptional regulator [Paenibacillus athensensis]|uniref:MerR family transcriptional regulator n=1 Tax=Paenibacillus athensensis TaxID=1967502 RepID=A0A4Y8Q729_9BACL|nr:MerR family transcriptional regulator [Paenibacillus athensensis]MCD1257410.1 MerR family transcriptional regulator [Paenibacillus athensensis]
MFYTVKEVAELSGATVKTLHHYHKIGLLAPREISEAGYRLYGSRELERLQEILFYRELDFSLDEIKQLLDGQPDRTAILRDQRERLAARAERLHGLVRTLELTLAGELAGEPLPEAELFRGFASAAQWRAALEPQRQYLREQYGFELLDDKAAEALDAAAMNEMAREAKRFMDGMADGLRRKCAAGSEAAAALIASHLAALNGFGHATTAADFAAQCRFFLADDFHRDMLESQQVGLAYYVCAAADAFAKAHTGDAVAGS